MSPPCDGCVRGILRGSKKPLQEVLDHVIIGFLAGRFGFQVLSILFSFPSILFVLFNSAIDELLECWSCELKP